jgi:hypothetical protein
MALLPNVMFAADTTLFPEFPIHLAHGIGKRYRCAARMPDELKLRYQARDVIRSSRLPLRKPDRMFGGPGSGALCPVCGELATKKELELEIEFNRHSVVDRFHLHPRCYAAWEFERTKVTDPASSLTDLLSRLDRLT